MSSPDIGARARRARLWSALVAGGLAVLLASMVVFASGATRAHATSRAAASAATSGPPVLPPFVMPPSTPLPCSPNTTVGMENCAARTVLKLDKQINKLAARIYRYFGGGASQRHFVAAAHDWLTFRGAECRSESDKFAGGTEARVVFVTCVVHEDRARIADLTGFVKFLTSRG